MWNSLFIFKDTNDFDGLLLHEAERNFKELQAYLFVLEWKHLEFRSFDLDQLSYFGLYFIIGDSEENLEVKLFILEKYLDGSLEVLLIILHDFLWLLLFLDEIDNVF